MNEGKNAVPKGVYSCRFAGATRSGKVNHTDHFIMSVRLIPTECGVENPCDYFAELPLIYKPGAEFGFYNRETNTNVRRKCTSQDTAAAWEYARRCFPAWSEHLDQLPATASYADALSWFDEPHDDISVRANIREPREYNGKYYYEATIYEARGGKTLIDSDEDFNAEFGKSLKAAGIKFGGAVTPAKAQTPPATATAAAAKKPAPPAPKLAAKPPKPSPAVSIEKLMQDAVECYPAKYDDDPAGAKYWQRLADVIGSEPRLYETWTVADWTKIVEHLRGF